MSEEEMILSQDYLEEWEEKVYQAIMNSPDDIEAFLKLQEEGEITDYEVFLVFVRHLIKKGRILKKN